MSEPEPAMGKAAQLSVFGLLRVAAQRCIKGCAPDLGEAQGREWRKA
jgi:hypothetical protein